MNVNNVLTACSVGKTLICTMLGDYFQQRGQRTLNLDLDPIGPAFSRCEGLNVTRIELKRNGKVDSGLYDPALEMIYGPDAIRGIPCTDYDQVIIDSGSASYLPLVHYMRTEEVLDHFQTLGYRHTIHVVLAGGRSLDRCQQSLDDLAQEFGKHSRIVVWLNEFFGAFPWQGVDMFYDSAVYRKHEHHIDGVVRMPLLDDDTPRGTCYDQLDQALRLSRGRGSRST